MTAQVSSQASHAEIQQDAVLAQVRNHIGHLTLNRPAGLNAITLNITGGTPTSVAVASGASHGTATASGTSITYTPTNGYSGSDSFTYTATNAGGTSAPATVTITVNPQAPVANAVSATVAYNSSANPITLSLSGGTATSVAVVLSTTLWIIGSISCFRRCRVTPTATRTQQMKTTKPVFICFLFIFPPTLSLFLSYFYFTIEVIGLRVPLAFTRKALALPNFRNISRRTGMWFSSSVI